MKLKLPIAVLLVTLSSIAYAQNCPYLSFEDHITTTYHDAVHGVKQAGLGGPLAEEIIRWALIRQLHENGLNRNHDYCIPGISCGGWNKDTLFWCLRKVPNEVKVTTVYDSEGLALYELRGRNAHVVSTAAIALLFDYYVDHFEWFTKQEKEDWAESRKCSYLISQGFDFPRYRRQFMLLKESRQRILRKCNGGYGPGKDRIVGERKKQEDLFNKLQKDE